MFADHDLAAANKIIPPNTKVDFTLTRSKDEFYILAKKTDAEKYKVKLLGIVLYCPIGIMSDRLTQEIYAKWEHTPIKYYYNRTVVKSLTMPISKAEFLSDNLFPESEAPTRVFIMLVESDAYLGTYSKSPFAFKRKWTVRSQQLNALHNSLQFENTYLKSSLDEMKGQLADLINALRHQNQPRSDEDEEDLESEDESLASKRAKKTKTSKRNLQKKPPKKVEKKLLRSSEQKNNEQKNNEKNNRQEPVAGGSSIMGRIINSINPFAEEIDLDEGLSDRQSISGQSNPGSIRSAAQISATLEDTSVNYWVTNVELELMSSPLDQMSSKGTEEDAMVDYVRLQRCLNQFNQVISSGISYDHFLSSAFIAAFDLTTNQQPGLAYAINTVRTGEKTNLLF